MARIFEGYLKDVRSLTSHNGIKSMSPWLWILLISRFLTHEVSTILVYLCQENTETLEAGVLPCIGLELFWKWIPSTKGNVIHQICVVILNNASKNLSDLTRCPFLENSRSISETCLPFLGAFDSLLVFTYLCINVGLGLFCSLHFVILCFIYISL